MNSDSFQEKKARIMRLSKPRVVIWWIVVILGVLGVLAKLGGIPALSAYEFWLVVAGLVVLVLGTSLKGL